MKREGRHLSVKAHGDEVYRVTCKPDGHYVTCDKHGNGIGDNIALVQEIGPGTGFAEAVYRLSGAPAVRAQPRPTEPKREPPKLPAQGLADKEYGRQYLQGRGISPDTLEHAEKAGMVRYMTGGVLFVGYDRAGVAQNVTKRAITSADPVQKRDFRGSDKRFPPILPGDPGKVWIVEGGADALALHDIAKRSGQQPPTVIVSGGSNVRGFLERAEVQAVLKRAERVTVCGENEKDAETQAKGDAGHQKQAERVAEITGREVRQWKPTPEQGKDVADMNARQGSGDRAPADTTAKRELAAQALEQAFKGMAAKRALQAHGWADTGKQWQTTPALLRTLIDEYNRRPDQQERAWAAWMRDPARSKAIAALIERRREHIRENARGRSR